MDLQGGCRVLEMSRLSTEHGSLVTTEDFLSGNILQSSMKAMFWTYNTDVHL